MSKSVYIVKSGQYDGNIGMTFWLNVRAFADYDKASAWIDAEKKRDSSFNEDLDFLEIDEVSLYD
jgi:hypothetical protein